MTGQFKVGDRVLVVLGTDMQYVTTATVTEIDESGVYDYWVDDDPGQEDGGDAPYPVHAWELVLLTEEAAA